MPILIYYTSYQNPVLMRCKLSWAFSAVLIGVLEAFCIAPHILSIYWISYILLLERTLSTLTFRTASIAAIKIFAVLKWCGLIFLLFCLVKRKYDSEPTDYVKMFVFSYSDIWVNSIKPHFPNLWIISNDI